MKNAIFLLLCYCSIFNMQAQEARFTENKGQWNNRIAYLLHTNSGNIFLEKDRFTFALTETPPHEHETAGAEEQVLKSHVYQSHFLGTNPNVRFIQEDKYEDYSNFYIGNDISKWKDHVYSYKSIIYKDLYQGIDIKMYAFEGNIKYDYLVSPQAWQTGGVSQIQVTFEGIAEENIHINEKGELVFETNIGTIQELKPYTYQIIAGEKKEIPCEYKLENGILSFVLDPQKIDKTIALVIDPVIVFSTYTGSTQDNWGFTSTYDNDGSAYGGGVIFGGNYPVGSTGYPTLGAFQSTYHGGAFDATITKFNSAGSNLIFSTYLGGNDSDKPHSMVVDANGNLFVMGITSSPNFPITSNAVNVTKNGQTDIFVCKFSPTGSFLAGTFMGGSSNDGQNGEGVIGGTSPLTYNYGDDARGEILTDKLGNVYVASCTQSNDFPTSNAYQNTFGGGLSDAILFKLNPDLSSLLFSTYLGGTSDDAAYSLVVDSTYQVYISGGTSSQNFPTSSSALSTNYQGNVDGFVAKFNTNGNTLLASTYIGTSSYDQNYFIQLENNNGVYLFGQSNGNFPVVGNVYVNPDANQYIAKLDPNLSNILLSTTFGTNSSLPNISPTAFMVDKYGNIYAAGWSGYLSGNNPNCTNSVGMPLTIDAAQNVTDGDDVYLAVFTPNLSSLGYATFWGGSGTQEHVDGGTCRYSPDGVVYHVVCGGCGGLSNIPTTPGVWSNTNNSSNCNLALFKLDCNLNMPSVGVSTSFVTQNSLLVSPNPILTDDYQVDFSLTDKENIEIELYDLTGKKIALLYQGLANTGNNRYSFERKNISSGAYYLLLRNKHQLLARSLILFE